MDNAKQRKVSVMASKADAAKNIFAQIIRVITIPPVMALAMLTALYFHGEIFENIGQYICAAVFLALLPTLAYPLQLILPSFKNTGRNGQRTLAMIMCNLGYILSIVYSLVFDVSKALLCVFLTYLASGLVLLIVNKLFKIKASGHACGIMGPMSALSFMIGWQYFAIGALLLAAAIWSSLRLHRHTASQLIIGGVISSAVFFILAAFML